MNRPGDLLYRVFWIRHTASGTLTVDDGCLLGPGQLPGFISERSPSPVDDAALSLLMAAVARAATEAAAAAHSNFVDVHLPVLERRATRERALWTVEGDAYVVAPGVVLVNATAPNSAVHRRGYAETLVAHGCYRGLAESGAAGIPELVFGATHSDVTKVELAGVLERYAITDPLPPAGRFDATITLRIPAAYLAAWLIGPNERTTRFYETYKAISDRLQRTLRTWLRALWLSDLSHFEDVSATRAAILYWLSRPHSGKSRSEFTYDVLAPENVRKMYRVGPARFAKELDIIHNRLRAAGHDELARHYRKLHLKEAIDAAKRNRRSALRIIAIESELLDALINFTVGVHRAGLSQKSLETESGTMPVFDLAAELMRIWRSALRRFPVHGHEHELAVLLLMEATAELRRSLDLPSLIEAHITIGGPWDMNGERKAGPVALAF